MKYVFLFFCALFFSALASAQTFSNNREKFAKDLNRYLSTHDAKLTKEFMKDFEPYILDKMNQAKFNRMVETCNKIHDKNLQPFPDMYHYVRSMYAIEKNVVEFKSFQVYHELLDENLDKSNLKYAKDYLKNMHDFFNDGILYSATNFYWYSRGGDYAITKGPNGAVFHFRDVNLTCITLGKDRAPVDSMALTRTDGIYDLEKLKWQGNRGVVTWEKVGLKSIETFASLKKYEISLRTTSYHADSVQFTTPYFKKPIVGNLYDHTANFTRDIDKKYPQFTSFERQLEIPNIVPNMNYSGGFAMHGNTFVGVGNSTAKAKIEYVKNNKLLYRLSANEININAKFVKTDNAQLMFKLGEKDSIYHLGMNYLFRRDINEADFMRDKTGQAVAPFTSSFHNLDIYVDRIVVNHEKDELLFKWHEGSSIEQRISKFESRNYFNGQQYDRLGGNASLHPLVALVKYVQKKGSNVLSEGEAFTALNGTESQTKPLLLELSGLGFISYDLEKKIVRVLPKTEQFVNARSNKADFDNIIFECDLRPKKIEGKSAEEIAKDERLRAIQARYDNENAQNKSFTEYAKLDLKTLDLELKGVRMVPISDKKNTQIFPNNRAVVVQKDRNFIFNGWVNTGKVEINITDGYFDYEKFLIQVKNSDQTFIRVNPLRPEDGRSPIVTQSYISGVKGEILVDDPKNRSGANEKRFGEFPKLISRIPTKVYYNNRNIQRGAYDSTRFYFDMLPFELDSAVTFNEKALRFSGEMITGGIFPKFKQELKIMPDYSLGFSMDAPKEGFDFYGSGSRYNNQILLSGNGLQGKGTIEYVTSIAESIGLLTFMPDSTIGTAKFITNPRDVGVQMPDVFGEEVFITYVPKDQVLKARSVRRPMEFFEKEAKFLGTVYVRPGGFTGSGKFNMPSGQLTSPNYTANRWQIKADTSSFHLRNTLEGEDGTIAFGSENLKCVVDFKARVGEFVSNYGESIIDFPLNQYVCKMDKFKWIMDVNDLELEKNPQASGDINIDNEMGLAKSNFFSTHPKQDSLDFKSLKARFDFKSKTLYCFEVEYIDVADARIFPEGKKLVIRRKAEMDPLENAEILANYITKYHKFINASITISGKRAYRGSGEYQYVDIQGTTTTFSLKTIFLDNSFQTVAEGNIPLTAGFELSPRFKYFGNFTIKAAEPTITFSGSTKLVHECEDFTRSWIVFKGPVDPKNVMIPIDANMKSDTGRPLASGIAWSSSNEGTNKMYPVFLSELLVAEDKNLIAATGFLQYNYEAQEYRISTQEKLINRGEVGDYIALHTPSCGLNGDGRINLGMLTPGVEIDAVGVINFDPKTKETSMNVTMKINMLFEETALEKLGEKIAIIPALSGLSADNLKYQTTLEQAFNTWTNKAVTDKFFSEYALRRSVKKMPAELNSTIILTGVKLFSIDSIPQFSGFSSFTEDAMLVSFYGQPVMRMLPMEIAFYRNDKNADGFGIYFFIPGSNNYFLYYQVNKKEGKLSFVTTDQDIRTRVNDVKPDKRKGKSYEYEASMNSSFYQVFRQLIRTKR
jgi:hypothetical protein